MARYGQEADDARESNGSIPTVPSREHGYALTGSLRALAAVASCDSLQRDSRFYPTVLAVIRGSTDS